MAQGELVPVGHVFEQFPGKYGPYIGIEVRENGFGHHDELTLVSGDQEAKVSVSSIEIDRQRMNIVKPGDKCAIKPAHPLPDGFNLSGEVTVHVTKAASIKAASVPQQATPRPPRFSDIRKEEGHHHGSFTR